MDGSFFSLFSRKEKFLTSIILSKSNNYGILHAAKFDLIICDEFEYISFEKKELN